ncbi:MAG: hypothetical protein ABSF62_22075 [Bryobacteraceae bacterium]
MALGGATTAVFPGPWDNLLGGKEQSEDNEQWEGDGQQGAFHEGVGVKQ